MAFAIQALGVLAGAAIPRGQVQDYGFLFLVVAAATVMPAETEFPCHRSNAMNGKTALLYRVCYRARCAPACSPGGRRPRRTAAAPGNGTGTCPGSRADARRPLGQYPGGDVGR